MNSQEVYNAWQKGKSRVDIRRDFADKVMSHVYQYEQNKSKPLFDLQHLVELVSAHPLAKAALIAMGAVTGFVRLMLMIIVILSKGDING